MAMQNMNANGYFPELHRVSNWVIRISDTVPTLRYEMACVEAQPLAPALLANFTEAQFINLGVMAGLNKAEAVNLRAYLQKGEWDRG